MTYLQCPMPACGFLEPVSEEDPDGTLSLMVHHLTGYFAGQHRLGQPDAMQWLAKVEEVGA
jgi:hypothetical protein